MGIDSGSSGVETGKADTTGENRTNAIATVANNECSDQEYITIVGDDNGHEYWLWLLYMASLDLYIGKTHSCRPVGACGREATHIGQLTWTLKRARVKIDLLQISSFELVLHVQPQTFSLSTPYRQTFEQCMYRPFHSDYWYYRSDQVHLIIYIVSLCIVLLSSRWKVQCCSLS